ncbi:MAG TPA: signal peptidase I [Gaiellaceae bacterium]|nr:signal peptidase I [Gaiellaceae bacterium]
MSQTPPSTEAPPPLAAPATTSGRPRLALAGTIASWILMLAAGVVALGLFAITVGPRFLPYQALIVRSGSMEPTIPTGSIVIYTKKDAAKVKVGDVIVFSRPGVPNEKVTHRVVKIGTGATGRYFLTKGDANGTPDDWQVPAVGTGWIAKFHIPAIGYALIDLQSTLGRLLLLIIPAMALGAITLYEIWRDRGGGGTA